MAADSSGKILKGIKGKSALLKLKYYDIVESTTIDYMHSVCIGVLKQSFAAWLDPINRSKPFYIRKKLKIINEKLELIKVPKTINRRPGKIEHFKTWKAHEYRNFLLYFGPIVLKNVLPMPYYQHFLLLSYSIYTFLQNEISKEEFSAASFQILEYVDKFEILYKLESMNHNIHLASHIPNCVLANGPLWAYSAFNMENKNSQINRVIKGTKNIIQESANKYCIIQSNRKPTQNLIKKKYFRNLTNLNAKTLKYIQVNSLYYCTRKFGEKKLTCDFLVEFRDKYFCEIVEIKETNGNLCFVLVKKFETYQKIGQFRYFYTCPTVKMYAKIEEITKAIKISDHVYVTCPNNFESD